VTFMLPEEGERGGEASRCKRDCKKGGDKLLKAENLSGGEKVWDGIVPGLRRRRAPLR